MEVNSLCEEIDLEKLAEYVFDIRFRPRPQKSVCVDFSDIAQTKSDLQIIFMNIFMKGVAIVKEKDAFSVSEISRDEFELVCLCMRSMGVLVDVEFIYKKRETKEGENEEPGIVVEKYPREDEPPVSYSIGFNTF
jgi:hypothetical protein